MDVKYINPFLSAINDIINALLGSKPVFNKPFLVQSPFHSEELLVIIGLSGEMTGKVMIALDKPSCLYIASKMMGGMAVEFDEVTKSAVGEMCNMILGTTATIFANKGIKIDITSPTIIEASQMLISQKEKAICIPIGIADSVSIAFNITSEKIVA